MLVHETAKNSTDEVMRVGNDDEDGTNVVNNIENNIPTDREEKAQACEVSMNQ